MRKKRVELVETVVIAARHWRQLWATSVTAAPGWTEGYAHAEVELARAVKALDEYEAANITGAGARWVEGSPATSRAAAGLAAPVQGSTRHEIVGLLATVPLSAQPGYTDDQLERRLNKSHQTISSARNWLVEAGWCRDSGQRRLTMRGRRAAVVWELTPAGHAALQERRFQ
jgi:hypothetical protein